MELEYKRVGDVDCITASGTPKEMAALVLELQEQRTASVVAEEDHLDLEGETVGYRIKAARKAAGLTQKDLAEKVGVDYQSVMRWEKGTRSPRIPTLQNLADVL